MAEARVKFEGNRVVCQLPDGHTVLDLDWKTAQALGRALVTAGLHAEEIDKHGIIARDSAIMMRAGLPLTLTNHPKILSDAKTLAEHDRDLRRFMPGIKSKEVVGTPNLIQHQPTKEQTL